MASCQLLVAMTASTVNPPTGPSASLLASGSDQEFQARNSPDGSVSPPGTPSKASQASSYSSKVGSNLASDIAPLISSSNTAPSEVVVNVAASEPLASTTDPLIESAPITTANSMVEQ